MKVAICDDKEIHLKHVWDMLQTVDDVETASCFTKAANLLKEIAAGEKYDLILMDIVFPEENENGIEYAVKINHYLPETQIIYMTAYNDCYAEKIFWGTVNLCGYLIKPIQQSSLEILLEKARKKQMQNEEAVIFCYNNGIEAILKKDILYLESEAHKIWIHAVQGDRIVYDKLNSYEQKMGNLFLRVHKSYLVNMDWIYSISSKAILLKNEMEIPVSRSKYQQVKERYFRYVRSELKGSL